jgi:two-component system CheB/CheR fusion protein
VGGVADRGRVRRRRRADRGGPAAGRAPGHQGLLQSLVSEHQANADDLAAANEELVATNEELQSTNEELQSTKEELQSTNEELGTVNDQLRGRNAELDDVANDLANVLTSVDLPVILVDLHLRVRRFTPTVRRVANFIPEDVGRPIDDLKLRVAVDDLPARIREVVDDLTPREWRIKDAEGRWYRMQIRPYRTGDNRLDGAVLSFVDVDALVRAVADAEAARDDVRSIVETVTSALAVLDEDLRIVTANDAFRAMFALAPSEDAPRSVLEVAGGRLGAPEVKRALVDALARNAALPAIELAIELPGGVRRVVSLNARPFLWGGGARRLLCTLDDVTGLRSLEAERATLLESERQARLEAERANHAKDLFLATLSHELRTPLGTILMSAQILRRVKVAEPAIERASAAIERAANAQARLIDDLLDVSRIVSGKLLLHLSAVDLVAIVEEAVDVARPSAEAKSVDLAPSIDRDLGTVYGDPARLLQVVNNLLTNAIKFTPRGGHVALRLERAGDRARLTVTDDGIGIRADVLPRLFSRFVQADSAVTRTHGGLGLGLAIVRHLVEAHGGEVRAESAGEGRGATFEVTLPIGVASRQEVSQGVAATTRSIDGVRVLLVEDDDDTREACAAMLATLGADVRSVPSAARGVAAVEEQPPQVILSDIAMPGEDGYAFMRAVGSCRPSAEGAFRRPR